MLIKVNLLNAPAIYLCSGKSVATTKILEANRSNC